MKWHHQVVKCEIGWRIVRLKSSNVFKLRCSPSHLYFSVFLHWLLIPPPPPHLSSALHSFSPLCLFILLSFWRRRNTHRRIGSWPRWEFCVYRRVLLIIVLFVYDDRACQFKCTVCVVHSELMVNQQTTSGACLLVLSLLLCRQRWDDELSLCLQ